MFTGPIQLWFPIQLSCLRAPYSCGFPYRCHVYGPHTAVVSLTAVMFTGPIQLWFPLPLSCLRAPYSCGFLYRCHVYGPHTAVVSLTAVMFTGPIQLWFPLPLASSWSDQVLDPKQELTCSQDSGLNLGHVQIPVQQSESVCVLGGGGGGGGVHGCSTGLKSGALAAHWLSYF